MVVKRKGSSLTGREAVTASSEDTGLSPISGSNHSAPLESGDKEAEGMPATDRPQAKKKSKPSSSHTPTSPTASSSSQPSSVLDEEGVPRKEKDKSKKDTKEKKTTTKASATKGAKRAPKASVSDAKYQLKRDMFLRYKELHGDSMIIPKNFVVPSTAAWPEEMWGYKLGVAAALIRMGKAHRDKQEDLRSIGFSFEQLRKPYGWERIKEALLHYKNVCSGIRYYIAFFAM